MTANQDSLNDLFQLAQSYLEQGRNDQAAVLYRKIIDADPDQYPAYLVLGLIALVQGQGDQAAAMFRQGIQINPDYAEAHYNLGNLLAEQQQNSEAITHYAHAIRVNPDYLEAFIGLGNAYTANRDFQRAIECYEQAVRINPAFTIAHFNLGNVLLDVGERDRAITHLKRAVSLSPDYAEAWNNLGFAQDSSGFKGDAMVSYQTAIKANPDFPDAYNNLGILYKQIWNMDDALLVLTKAVSLAPNFANAHNNLGTVQDTLGHLDQAIASFKMALSLDENMLAARQNLFRAYQHACDWSDDAEDNNDKYDFLQPFPHLTCCDDPKKNWLVAKRAAQKYSALFRLNNAPLPKPVSHDPEKINIGYISSDIHDHATSHLMVRLFALHDREKFHITLFSYGRNDKSTYRVQIEKDVDQFIDLEGADYRQMAEQIRLANIQILVELKGHTINNCLKVCALRPAPVIMSWLGFPGTTGADFIDYIITDKIVSPPDEQAYYSEALLYMPHCYQINDHQQIIADRRFTRAELGLPEDGFVFCSFNSNFKSEPVMFDLWMRLLDQVPDSVLWLKRSNDLAEKNLCAEARKRGIDPNRLIFAGYIQKGLHLSRLQCADLALDTRICGGHTTTSDALWAGVPVVTLKGRHFASRVSASILYAVGLPELVTSTLEDYENLALQLAKSPEALEKIRRKLEQQRLTDPLYDTPRFVTNLERGYTQAWENFLSGKAPSRIDVHE